MCTRRRPPHLLQHGVAAVEGAHLHRMPDTAAMAMRLRNVKNGMLLSCHAVQPSTCSGAPPPAAGCCYCCCQHWPAFVHFCCSEMLLQGVVLEPAIGSAAFAQLVAELLLVSQVLHRDNSSPVLVVNILQQPQTLFG